MKRRAVLATLGAALPGLAGCAALTGDRPQPTVTPAPVPDAPETPRMQVTEAPELLECPRLPAEAGRYICSPESSDGLRMVPETERYDPGAAGLVLALRNGADRGFAVERGRWLLTQQTADGWLTIDAGAAGSDLSVAPGEEMTWVVGGTPREARTGQLPVGGSGEPVRRAATEFGSGVHAFVVTGELDGLLTAVAAPFLVRRSSR